MRRLFPVLVSSCQRRLKGVSPSDETALIIAFFGFPNIPIFILQSPPHIFCLDVYIPVGFLFVGRVVVLMIVGFKYFA